MSRWLGRIPKPLIAFFANILLIKFFVSRPDEPSPVAVQEVPASVRGTGCLGTKSTTRKQHKRTDGIERDSAVGRLRAATPTL